MASLHIEEWPIDRLRPNPKNYRIHSDKKVRHVMALLQEYGFYGPIVVAPDGTILARHSVYEAARRLGYSRVPVCVVRQGDPDKLLVADNEVAKLVEEDEAALIALLAELQERGELEGTGWEPDELQAILRDIEGSIEELADEYATEQAAAQPAPPEQAEVLLDAEGQLQAIRFRFGPYGPLVPAQVFEAFKAAWEARLQADPGALLADFVAEMVAAVAGGKVDGAEQAWKQAQHKGENRTD